MIRSLFNTADESTVVKVFWEDQRDRKADKVRAMVDSRPQVPTYEERNAPKILWPEAAGEDPETGAFLGYNMPYRDLKQTKS